MTTNVIKLHYSKSTRNTYVYKAKADDDSIVPIIYIKRKAFNDCDNVPKTIQVTIDVLD